MPIKRFSCARIQTKFIAATVLLLFSATGHGLRSKPNVVNLVIGSKAGVISSEEKGGPMVSKEVSSKDLVTETYVTGSTLPDCSHACGPCFPCKRVTVSFKCSLAESCPIVYRCMCRGRYYHVPSN